MSTSERLQAPQIQMQSLPTQPPKTVQQLRNMATRQRRKEAKANKHRPPPLPTSQNTAAAATIRATPALSSDLHLLDPTEPRYIRPQASQQTLPDLKRLAIEQFHRYIQEQLETNHIMMRLVICLARQGMATWD